MKAILYTISLSLATLLGFAVHRASLCTVKTVAEIFSTRKIYMIKAMLKTVLWVLAVSMPISLFLPDVAAPNRSYAVSFTAIIGGFVFGVGAAINGGCAFSTLGYLANGNFWMLTTLLGYCLGVAGLSIIVPMIGPGQALTPLLLKAPSPLIFTMIAALWLLLSWEIFRLWKTREKDRSLSQLFLSKYYRLSTAALVLGFTGGVLYSLYDTWTYTNALKQKVQSIWMPVEKPATINLLLFLALFLGMVVSALQRRSWRLQWHPIQTWPRHLIGGALMGAGAVLIPGGNDTLMLKSLPGLSPHALPAMLALFAGIGITLPLLRLLTGKSLKVVCTDDICQARDQFTAIR